MASIGTLGFLSGASKTFLSSLDAREEQDRKLARDKKLEELRREGEKIARDATIAENDKKINERLTQYDDDAGKKRFYNDKGILIREEDIPMSERTLRQNAMEKDRLSLDNERLQGENLRSQISSRARDDARQDRYTAAAIANMGRKDGGLDGSAASGRSSSSQDVAALIRNDYSDVIKEFGAMQTGLDNGGRPAEYVTALSEQAAAIALREARAQGKDPSWMYNRAREIFTAAIRNRSKSSK